MPTLEETSDWIVNFGGRRTFKRRQRDRHRLHRALLGVRVGRHKLASLDARVNKGRSWRLENWAFSKRTG